MTVKEAVIRSEHRRDTTRFVVPADSRDRAFYQEILNSTNEEIIPKYRRKVIEDYRARDVGNDEDLQDLKYFYTAFGLTATVDRTLVDEVAKMEVSLVRHALNLRHLVLRYAKALLLFLLTTVLLVIFAALITNFEKLTNVLITPTQRSEFEVLMLSLMFVLWALLTPWSVTLPISWIYASADRRTSLRADRQLVVFERVVVGLCIAVFFVAAILSEYALRQVTSLPSWSNLPIFGLIPFVIFAVYWIWKSFLSTAGYKSTPPNYPINPLHPTLHNDTTPQSVPVSQVSSPSVRRYDERRLIELMTATYSHSEFEMLCKFLDVESSSLSANAPLPNQFAQLIDHLKRHEKSLDRLIDQLVDDRPIVDWRSLEKDTTRNS